MKHDWLSWGLSLTGGLIAGAGLAVGTLAATGQLRESDPKPVVVTTEDNRIIDMPAGVRWMVKMESGELVEVDF